MNPYLKGYKAYLTLEQHLSPATVEAYAHDVNLFLQYLDERDLQQSSSEDPLPPSSASCDRNFWAAIPSDRIENFTAFLFDLGMSPASQARILSGLKSFFDYLVLENVIVRSPAEEIESPKLRRHLPEVLSYQEILKILDSFDLSKPEGRRNRAIVEVLYACGLRVSELVGLKIPMLYFDDGFVRIIGKGDKERLVPIGEEAMKQIRNYIEYDRCHLEVRKGHEDTVFLNRYGKALSRVMVFKMVKQAAAGVGIAKTISPHTFRHSFATHLVEGGADLRAVQDMLGHESITTTEIYTHIDRRYLQDTIRMYHPMSRGAALCKDRNTGK